MTTWLPLLCFCTASVALRAQSLLPERIVHENVIRSASDPSLQITLPKEVKYVGSDRWLLYGVADCEVHVFVEADTQKKVRRYYWIQFEAYVPSEPALQYNYRSNPVRTIGDLPFFTRPQFGATDDPVKPGSDAEHVRQLIQAKGYTMPAGMMNVRLVHLPSEDRRKELMIIYAEDTEFAGVAWRALLPGGSAADRWPELQRGLIENATRRIQFSR